MMPRTKITSIILLFSAFTMLVSCGEQKDVWKGSLEEVDGVTVVKNPKEPMYGEDVFSLEEELSIGEAEGSEEYMFSRIRDIAVDDRGYIYALDLKARHVKVYNEKGEYVRIIGKGGQGPGEFRIPFFILISPSKELVVTGMRKVSYFKLDGEFIRSQNLSTQNIAQLKFDKFGDPIGTCILSSEENPRIELRKFNLEFETKFAIDSSPISRTRSTGFNPFDPVLRWDMIRGEHIVCGYGGEGYILKIYDLEGKLIKSIHKDYDPAEVTDRDIEVEMQRHGIDSREFISAPEFKPPFRWIDADEEGRIFAQSWELIPESEGYYYDVFDTDGKYLLRVPIKAEWLIFKKLKLHTIVRDNEGYQYVKRYKVTWRY